MKSTYWLPACAVLLLLAALPAHAQKTAAEFNSQGVEYYNNKQWDEALQCFLEAYRLAPDHPTVRKNLCNAYHAVANDLAKQSDFASAAKHLELAISILPENPAPLIQLGACYLQLDYVDYAICRLEEAIDMAPENIDAHDLLGDAYYRDGDAPSALVQWEWVFEVQPQRKGIREKVEKARREVSVEHDYNHRHSRHFQVQYAPGTSRGDLGKVLTLLESAYREIGRNFGGVYPAGPIQVKAYTADDFSKATLLGDHVGAVYDGTIRLPIEDKKGKVLTSDELKRRIFHEYTHVVVHHLLGDNVAWWLNEGLAETFSNQLSADEVTLLKNAYHEGKQFPTAGLQDHQLQVLPPEQLMLAYIQSHATVRYLWETSGQRRLISLMNLLAGGLPPRKPCTKPTTSITACWTGRWPSATPNNSNPDNICRRRA